MEGKRFLRLAKTSLTTIAVASILALSSFVSYAAPAQVGTNWNGVGGNYPFNFDYSPQTAISAGNVLNLQVSWIFPIAAPPKAYAFDFGVVHTPIVVNGIEYAVTNYHQVLALDAKDGKVVWTKQLPLLNFSHFDLSEGNGHYHAIWYTSQVRGGVPLLWIVANNYTVFAYNALTGDQNLVFSMFNLATKVPGNFGAYGTITPQIVIDEKRGILVMGNSVSEGVNSGRGFYEGFDITSTPPRLLWRTFLIPPQDGSDPNWAIKSVQNMSYAYIFDGTNQIDLKSLSSSQQQSILYGDWGNFGFNGTHSFAGAATGWGGSWALDPATGIAYVGNGQASADWNATTRPGPNLWASSVMALDDTTGKIIWAFQTTPHDLWDWDCSWSVMLANATVSGQTHKTVLKGCKNGYLYALDATTGKMFWAFNAPSIKRAADSRLLNPMNRQDMTKPWEFYPATKGVQNPWGAGGIESDPAYDPTSNTAFVATYNYPQNQQILPITGPKYKWTTGPAGLDFSASTDAGPHNTTIWAVDVNTGQAKWSFFIDKLGFRGGLSLSNGVVYVPLSDGNLDFLDAKTGTLIGAKYIGTGMITQPAIAADANGDYKVFLPASSGSGAFAFLGFPSTPGFLFALSLPPATPVQTKTSISVSTSVSTQTVAGPSTGIDPTTFYAVTGFLVIVIIGTGVLAVRRRTPAS